MTTRLGVAVLGCTGRLGTRIVARVLASPDLRLAAAVTRAAHPRLGVDAGTLAGTTAARVPVTAIGSGCFADAHVVIDVSLAGGIAHAAPFLVGRPLVSGVTGQTSDGRIALMAHSGEAAVLTASNFSAGVHVLADLVARAAAALPDYDIEILEAHHRQKVDAPSGTALHLAEAAATARGRTLDDAVYGRKGRTTRGGEIAIHAIRGGDIVGEHQVWLAGEGERLQLGHTATSRDVFAAGALRAARWVVHQPPGMYGMRDALNL
jgi:4-hydroxy-tetrahydrodipicolinate reductase